MRRTIIYILAFSAACTGSPELSESATAPAPRIFITIAGPGAIAIPALHSTCHGTCSFPTEPGAKIHLEVASDPEGAFAGWSGACAGSGTCDVVGGEDLLIGASFTP